MNPSLFPELAARMKKCFILVINITILCLDEIYWIVFAVTEKKLMLFSKTFLIFIFIFFQIFRRADKNGKSITSW